MGVLAAAALLAGCSGGAPPPGLASLADGRSATELFAGVNRNGVARRDLQPSWISPDAKSAPKLLYVSDLGTFDVDVYSFPSLARTGKLTGFNEPQGECADAAGDVWITNTKALHILKFSHGGAKPIASLSDPIGYPASCAIDPTNGDLAVTNLYGFSGGGSVLIYKHAAGTPTPYANLSVYYYYFAGYDPSGDLYVSGATNKHAYSLMVLPHASSSMPLLTIDGGTLYFPGTVAWHGSSLVLGDQRCNKSASSCFYELSVSGKTARITGTTPLSGACDVAQAWVGATQLAGGDYASCGDGHSSVAIWPFPAGGNPTKRVTGLQMPVGAALSVKSSSP